MPPTPPHQLLAAGACHARVGAALLGLMALGACASPPPASADACRLLARPADAGADASTLAAQAARATGLAVRAEPAAPAGWWLLHLDGSDATDCERAAQQLAAAQPPLFAELHADARRRSPPRPHGPSTR